ncbi:MAG: hypothetical protein NZT92_10505 [Abditibacteriales bacterium]|nr:hypothetical protein [Abditibacteriales bacterium]MDW8364205.1 hypothetical protein [Abditibacteriales bacterium]
MKPVMSIFEYARLVTRIEEEILTLLLGDEPNGQKRKNPPTLRPSQVRPPETPSPSKEV